MKMFKLLCLQIIVQSIAVSSFASELNPYASPAEVHVQGVGLRSAIDKDMCTAGLLVTSQHDALAAATELVEAIRAQHHEASKRGEQSANTKEVFTVRRGDNERSVVVLKANRDLSKLGRLAQTHVTEVEAFGTMMQERNFKPSGELASKVFRMSCVRAGFCSLSYGIALGSIPAFLYFGPGVDPLALTLAQLARLGLERATERFVSFDKGQPIRLMSLDIIFGHIGSEIFETDFQEAKIQAVKAELEPWLESEIDSLFATQGEAALVLFQSKSTVSIGYLLHKLADQGHFQVSQSDNFFR